MIVIGIGTVLVGFEAFRLIGLQKSVKRYTAYWQNSSPQGEFVYVALGDSLAQGVGASDPAHGYVSLLAKRIADKTGKSVKVINLSVSGATILDTSNVQLPRLATLQPNLVTIDIGSNDIYRTGTKDFETHLAGLLTQLPAGSFVANIPYFGGRVRRDKEVAEANIIYTRLLEHSSLHPVDTYDITHSRQSLHNYAADLFHPSNRGYTNWTDAFWQTIEPTL